MRASWVAPHRRHTRSAWEREGAAMDEPQALIPTIVRRIRGLEVRGRPFPIYLAEILGEERHPVAMPSVSRIGREQAEVVVRAATRMGRIEAMEPLIHDVPVLAVQLLQQGVQLRLGLRR